MKIRYVYDQVLPSRDTDTEQVLNTVAALGRRGVDVELLIPEKRGAAPLGVEVLARYYQVDPTFRVRQQAASFEDTRVLHKLAHGVRGARARSDADVFYTRNLHAALLGLLGGHRVAYEHFRPWPDQYPPLEPPLRWMLRHPRFVGAVLHSEHILPSYLRLGAPRERFVVAHNGYEPRRMEPRLEAVEARRQLDLPVDGALVVYTGRVHERKGLLAVLELARRMPETRFAIVGSEGEGRVELEARLLANVIVRPWQRFDATVRYLYAADVLMIPPTLSPLEQHGNTVLPMKLFIYLASGRPIYAPRAPDTTELLEHDVNAVVVPPDDAAAQERELRALLDDGARRERLGEASRARAAGLTWDARAEKLERFLAERLAAPAAESSPVADWSAAAWLRTTLAWVERRVNNG